MAQPIVLMVRHGETQLNAQDAFRSWMDVPLDDKGVQQAHDVAEYLANFPVSLIVASPLTRAQQTAHIIGQKLGLEVEVDSGLLPWNLGVLSGQPKEPLKAIRDYYLDHPDEPVPQGESIKQFEQRFAVTLNSALTHAQSGALPLLITHTSNVVAAHNLLTGAEDRPEASDTVQPGGVAAIEQNGQGLTVKPIFRGNEEAIQGTRKSGYIENGKQYCGDCTHRQPGQPICIHPEVIADPEMQDRKEANGVRIDLENGCCDYVNKGETVSSEEVS